MTRQHTSHKRDCSCPLAKHQHGTRGAYQKDGCRCFPCRLASSRADARVKAGGTFADPGVWVPRCGMIRRLEALHAMGWTEPELGQRLGMSKQAIRSLRAHNSQVVLASTHAKIAALYDDLWNEPATGRYATRTRNWAARRRFAPPLAWDNIDDPAAEPWREHRRGFHLNDPIIDEIAVDEAVRGERKVRLTTAEQAEAVRRLTGMGISAQEIARRLRVDPRSVVRHRTADNEEAA